MEKLKKWISTASWIALGLWFSIHAYHQHIAAQKIESIRHSSPTNRITPEKLADILDELNN
jgi:hypothetical protein